MALTKRGMVLSTVGAVFVAAAVVVTVLFLGGRAGLGPLAKTNDSGAEPRHTFSPPPPPPECPLTGVKPAGGVPNRPALAIKVENAPAARPQYGLSYADVVYEEPVEASITRFIAIYQCHDAARVEPVRSGRLTDPDILDQLGHPIMGYAGGVPQVVRKIRAAHIVDVNVERFPKAYVRDPARVAPHNLYTGTDRLYAVARSRQGAPPSLFLYSTDAPAGRAVSTVHLPFSQYSDVYWRWSASKEAWLRWHGTVPHLYSDGQQVRATNVVIQVVRVRLTSITDVNGVHSPEVVATGSGPAYVLRNGRMVQGTWRRPKLSDLTRFYDRSGKQIMLQPGTTWVELLPNDVRITFSS
jgi:Protein of unknown function (DUF3048) N-terminal domain/Protein of unknown function (DUF3048) C-terminal domain